MESVDLMIAQMLTRENERHDRLIKVLHYIQFTPGFHLTGSRAFGTATEESDYDFFIEDTETVMRTLYALGFSTDWNSGYSDSDQSVSEVMVFNEGPIQIHVQMISSVYFKKKLAAQEKIAEYHKILPDIMKNLSKRSMKIVWRRLITML